MRQYKAPRISKSSVTAESLPPVLPVFASGDPAVGDRVYRFFNQRCEFIGWCSYAIGRKFLIGKLYYKTKGAYRIRSARVRDVTDTQEDGAVRAKEIHIYEKETGALALYALLSVIKAPDLVDLDDRLETAKILRLKVEAYKMNEYNYHNYPKDYKLFSEQFEAKLKTDLQDFIKSKKQEMLAYIDGIILDTQQSRVVEAANVAATGGDWDARGLV